MKKFGRKLAIVLAMMMIFTSFEFVGVFAYDTPEGEPAIAEESAGESANEVVADPVENGNTADNEVVNATVPSEKVMLREGNVPDITDDDLVIEDLLLRSGYNCVVLRWKKIKIEGVDADSIKYYVYDSSANSSTTDPIASTDSEVGGKYIIDDYSMATPRDENGMELNPDDYLMCVISQPVSVKDNDFAQYRYTVKAVVGDHEGPARTSNVRAPVRTIGYKFTVKQSTTLKRHGGSASGPKTYKLKKGQTLICYGFGGGGCYMFNYKGSIFYCAKIRAKKPTAIYSTGFNYSREEAELFLNQRGGTSKTGVYLWCNQYTQHFYYMTGSKGNWKCTDDWECSTGKPSSPTPTGMWGTKNITGKWKKHHNIKWWSKFSGTNSVHGQKKSWKMGRPKSNGCIRNPVIKAEKVYRYAIVNTSLLVY